RSVTVTAADPPTAARSPTVTSGVRTWLDRRRVEPRRGPGVDLAGRIRVLYPVSGTPGGIGPRPRYLSAERDLSRFLLPSWRNSDGLFECAGQQVRVAPSRPDRHVGLGRGVRVDSHLAVARAHLHRRDALVAAPLELLGEPDRPGEQRQPLLVVLVRELPELGRVGLALAVVAGDQRDQVQLARREARQARVEDQVARVLVV